MSAHMFLARAYDLPALIAVIALIACSAPQTTAPENPMDIGKQRASVRVCACMFPSGCDASLDRNKIR